MAITLNVEAIVRGKVTLSTDSVNEFEPAIRDAHNGGYLSKFGEVLVKKLDEGKTEEAITLLLRHALREGLKDFNQQVNDEVVGMVDGKYTFAPAVVKLTAPVVPEAPPRKPARSPIL